MLEHPQALADLDGGATLLNWQYEPDVTDDKVRVLADAGARQYVCPAVQGWNRTLPRLHDAWRNIDGLSAHGIRYGAEGFLLTDWGDYGHVNDPRLSLPAMMYGAEYSWRGERAGFDEINRRVGSLIFGDTTGAVMEAWDERSRRPAFPWHDAIRLLELDEGDGALNRDVLATFAQLGTPDEHVVSSAGTVAEARRLFLGSMAGRLGAVPSMPRALPLVQRALAKARVRAADRREAGVLALAAGAGSVRRLRLVARRGRRGTGTHRRNPRYGEPRRVGAGSGILVRGVPRIVARDQPGIRTRPDRVGGLAPGRHAAPHRRRIR